MRLSYSLVPFAISLFGILGCQSAQKMEENVINHEVTVEERRAASSTTPIEASSVVLYVNGMGCPLCASNIDRQLKMVGGVARVGVDLSIGRVEVQLKDSGRPSPYMLGEAVRDAGFTLVKVETR